MVKALLIIFFLGLLLSAEWFHHSGQEPTEKITNPTDLYGEQQSDKQAEEKIPNSTDVNSEQQGDKQSEDKYSQFAKWATTIMNIGIYWTLHDGLHFSTVILERWRKINNPILRFGVFFGAVMALLNVYLALKRAVLVRKLSIFCPHDLLKGKPIPGTYNRYRCSDGHQFNGDPHGVP